MKSDTPDATPKKPASHEEYMTPMHSITEENVKEKETSTSLNPFDIKAESLSQHLCSPFFTTVSQKKDGLFRWSIEQMSVLCPADIDETSYPETSLDSDQEMKAQKAIDTFFSQSSIVPSPWSNSPCIRGNRNDMKLRRTNIFFNKREVENSDAATQTALSIPPDVDLKSLLSEYFISNEEEDSFSSPNNSQEECDPLSTSSLRRKLFVTEEECTSPVKVENKNLICARLWSTPTSKSHSLHSSPASDVLSSSPITPPICSESCNILSPPPVSPIAACRSSINEAVQMKSFEEDSSGNIYYSPESNALSHTSDMSVLVESQDTNPFPSCSASSEKQDTGYVTGSISSSQNMNFSEVNYGIVSRIAPVMKLMEEYDLSNSATDMSYQNACPPTGGSLTFDTRRNAPVTNCNLKQYPWEPTCSSTPAHMFNES